MEKLNEHIDMIAFRLAKYLKTKTTDVRLKTLWKIIKRGKDGEPLGLHNINVKLSKKQVISGLKQKLCEDALHDDFRVVTDSLFVDN